jgi:hypothetical protein
MADAERIRTFHPHQISAEQPYLVGAKPWSIVGLHGNYAVKGFGGADVHNLAFAQ